jgi:hypothetical protein
MQQACTHIGTGQAIATTANFWAGRNRCMRSGSSRKEVKILSLLKRIDVWLAFAVLQARQFSLL